MKTLITSLVLGLPPLFAQNLPLGPRIQCTVIKLISTTRAFGFEKFPALYQSINNDPIATELKIGGRIFAAAKPMTLFKNDNHEKILIGEGITLDLKGRPISRTGSLQQNGTALAEVTCH